MFWKKQSKKKRSIIIVQSSSNELYIAPEHNYTLNKGLKLYSKKGDLVAMIISEEIFFAVFNLDYGIVSKYEAIIFKDIEKGSKLYIIDGDTKYKEY